MTHHTEGSVEGFDAARERLAGALTLGALVIAFAMANSPLYEAYWFIHHTPVSVQIGDFGINKPLIAWINEGLLVFFFLLVGLEIKREMLEGRLAGRRQFTLPALAALGGMVVPAAIYLLINGDDPVAVRGWAIPMATDIVLALAALSLLRGRVPESLFIFLAALAVFDDVGAILVIALFYPETIHIPALMAAVVGVAALVALNRYKVVATAPYVLAGVFLWAALLNSGLHATLAGVVVALVVPLHGKRKDISCSPLREMERGLRPWVVLGIVPVFAFFNAGIALPELSTDILLTPLTFGVVLGLFLGKQVGIFGMTWLAVRLGISRLPEGVSWMHVYGVALLAGIGFTMSLFITSLAFADADLLAAARFAIIIGSLISAAVWLLVLRSAATPVRKPGGA
ncbi:MAG: Na+/H+ antiporter NhaA [Candidatus Polarisedimenticolaceae bacterium]|nr:Na+/H+ antiporter NhaA [Candidatus Polarisedimenticolaceae bacterium]